MRSRLFRQLAAALGVAALIARPASLAAEVATVADARGGAVEEGVTASEIVVGMSAPFTGASRGLGIELYRGSLAYLTEVNATGGILGRRVTLKAYDDEYQPALAVKNSLKLMLEDRVFVLFDYVGTPTVTRVLPLLKKFEHLHFELLFPFTGAQPQREAPYDKLAFNLRASYRQETLGLVQNLLAVGRKRIAVFYQADAYGRSGWVGVREALARSGEKIVGEATYTRGTKFGESLDRQVAIFQGVRPDAVVSVGAYEACAAFIRDARKAGLDVPIANLSFVGSESMLKLLVEASRADGRDYTANLVTAQVVPSYESTTIPAVREYREMMAKYDPAPPPGIAAADYKPLQLSFVSLEGFLNAKLLVVALTRLGDNPDRSKLASAVFGIRDLDLGTGPPVTFGTGRNQGSDAIYYTTVSSGRFVPISDWQRWSK